MGVGALTDFGPMLKNLRLVFFGAAAQIGIFSVLIFASLLGFTNQEAASLAIIGGADGPTAIYTSIILAPHLLAPIAMDKGLKFAIREGGRTVGAGVVAEIIE